MNIFERKTSHELSCTNAAGGLPKAKPYTIFRHTQLHRPPHGTHEGTPRSGNGQERRKSTTKARGGGANVCQHFHKKYRQVSLQTRRRHSHTEDWLSKHEPANQVHTHRLDSSILSHTSSIVKRGMYRYNEIQCAFL